MKFAHLVSKFNGSAWFIREEALLAITRLIESRINSPLAATYPIEPAPVNDAPEVEMQAPPGVALIPVMGMLGKRLSMMEMICGGCDYDVLGDSLEEALASVQTTGAVLVFDSPGGTVVGCQEAHARIAEICAASDKPVFAFTDCECCSAAYYLASACDAIYCTPSAILGSTGAKVVLQDNSDKLAKDGVKFHVFKSGTMKDIGASYRPPTDEEAKIFQDMVTSTSNKFRDDVTAARPKVDSAVFETARFYTGPDALALGLVDEIVPSLRSVLESMSAPAVAVGANG